MNLLAISGSVREKSYNLALLHAMKELCPKGSSVSVYNQLKDIPTFNPDIAEQDTPNSVLSLISMMKESDGIIISTPEYAHGVPGALKNTLDWLVSSDVLILKPIAITSVSTSGLGGVRSHSSLVLILSAMNTHIVIEGSINVPYAHNKFDDSMNLTDKLTKKAIDTLFIAMKQSIENA